MDLCTSVQGQFYMVWVLYCYRKQYLRYSLKSSEERTTSLRLPIRADVFSVFRSNTPKNRSRTQGRVCYSAVFFAIVPSFYDGEIAAKN